MARLSIALRTQERDSLRAVLQDIDQILAWYRATSGSLSHHDMLGMLEQVQSKIEAARELVYSK